jgi:protein-S-isoprenylcysteine O-methyltransferase Ste14
LPLGFVLGVSYVLFARPTPIRLLTGAAIAVIGLALRAWASGHIVKNDRLATGGPYAFTRNPLYFGSFLIGCGFAVAAHWVLLLIVWLFFALVYAPVIAREAEKVRQLHPAEYEEWARNVPPFVPRLTPWRNPARADTAPFSPSLYMRHREWQAALGFALAIVVLVVRMRVGSGH